MLLILGYFTCGFQLFFITVHLPAYLVDRGLPASIGGWTIAVIGLFNIVGSIGSGYIANLMPKRYLLSAIYFSRSLAILVFILLPPSPAVTLIFGAVIGVLWLSTIPPTSALVAIMFGTALADHAARARLLQPSGRRLPRRLARRRAVRAHRLL